MAKLSNIMKITVKINLEVILLDIVKISIQNKILHTKIRLRHASNQFDNAVSYNLKFNKQFLPECYPITNVISYVVIIFFW